MTPQVLLCSFLGHATSAMELIKPDLSNLGRATSPPCLAPSHPPSDSEYRQLFDLAGLGSATIVQGEVGGVGYLSSCSLGRARLVGLGLDDMVGVPLDSLAHKDDREGIRVSDTPQGRDMHASVPFS